jgi:hypothetical protein
LKCSLSLLPLSFSLLLITFLLSLLADVSSIGGLHLCSYILEL